MLHSEHRLHTHRLLFLAAMNTLCHYQHHSTQKSRGFLAVKMNKEGKEALCLELPTIALFGNKTNSCIYRDQSGIAIGDNN